MRNKVKKPESHDPLAEELNFEKLEVVAYGPGWKKTRSNSRGPKFLREDRGKLTRKSTSSKSRRRAA